MTGDSAESRGVNGDPQLYDFRSPSRFNREQVRALTMVNETFARQLATVLSTTLRMVAHCNVLNTGPLAYHEYTRGLPTPSLLAILDFSPLPGQGIFQLPMDIVMGVIDRLLGGPGSDDQPSRALSDIETGLIHNLVSRMVHELTYSFDTLAPVRASVSSLESDGQFLQLAAPSDSMMISEFEIKMSDQTAISTLCIPVQTIQPILDTLKEKPELELTGAQATFVRQLRQGIETVPVDVHVMFRPISLTSKEVLELQEGDILPLRHPTNQPLMIAADGVPVATGVPGSHGHRLACQITAV